MTTELETRLREIEEREKAATPGPWDEDSVAVVSNDCALRINPGSRQYLNTTVSWCVGPICRSAFYARNDAEFFRHAREDIPFLISEVRRLQNELCSVTTVMQCSRCENSQRPRYMVDGMCGECATKELEKLRAENKELGVRLLDSRNLVYERCVEIDKLRDWQKRAVMWLEVMNGYTNYAPDAETIKNLLTEAEAGE